MPKYKTIPPKDITRADFEEILKRVCQPLKRQGGKLIDNSKDGEYLVMTESVGQEGVGWKHICGTTLLGRKLDNGDIIPYCPKCEIRPFGTIKNQL